MSKKITLNILIFYKKYLSPLFESVFGNACRFTPTCSEYTIEAVDKKGVILGLWSGFRRFLKCNPLSKSVYDPVR